MSPTPLITPSLGGGALPPWTGPVRVTTYELDASEWPAAQGTYSLVLEDDLAPDYFALIFGASDNGNPRVAHNSVRVSADPFGTGELGTSANAWTLDLVRQGTGGVWHGTIVVVESLEDQATKGFQLLDVLVTSVPAAAADPQVVDDVSSVGWGAGAKVVPFGGPRGGGCSTTVTIADQWQTGWGTLEIVGTDTVRLTRSGPTGQNQAATWTTHIVQWGSEWDYEAVTVSGNNAGDGIDATAEYNTGTITSVVRANAWVWPTLRTSGCVGIGCSPADREQGAITCAATLGDGVNQSANETEVAVGKEFGTSRTMVAYVLEHASLAVDYRFKADGDAATLTVDVTVDAPVATESYDEASNPRVTQGGRFGLFTNSGGQADGRFDWTQYTIWPRPRADTTVRLRRVDDGQLVNYGAFPGWLQVVDFGGF